MIRRRASPPSTLLLNDVPDLDPLKDPVDVVERVGRTMDLQESLAFHGEGKRLLQVHTSTSVDDGAAHGPGVKDGIEDRQGKVAKQPAFFQSPIAQNLFRP